MDKNGEIAHPGSPVTKWGDLSIGDMKLTEFLGTAPDTTLYSSLMHRLRGGKSLKNRLAAWKRKRAALKLNKNKETNIWNIKKMRL